MKNLNEVETFAAYLGDTICPEKLEMLQARSVDRDNTCPVCEKYVISSRGFSDDEALLSRYQILPALRDYWLSQGLSLEVFLFLRKGKLVGGQIHKVKECTGDGVSYEMQPTLQEIRLLRRILDDLTEEKKNGTE